MLLIDGHSAGNLGFDVVHVDGVEVGLLVDLSWRGLQMWLKTRAEVAHADDGVDDGKEDEEDGDDGKGGQRLPHGFVRLLEARLVDSHKLEDEVGESAEVENDDADHSWHVLPAGEEGGGNKNYNGYGNRNDGQGKLGVALLSDDDDELNNETEEEEEIELEQGNVNLGRVSDDIQG